MRPTTSRRSSASSESTALPSCTGSTPDTQLDDLESELERQQGRLLAGELPEVCGTVILDDPDALIDGRAVRPLRVPHHRGLRDHARTPSHHPVLVEVVDRLLGPRAWLLEDDRFGVVYQDARPATRLRLLADRLALRRAVGPDAAACGRRWRSPSTSTRRHRATGSSASFPARISADRRDAARDSSTSPARSASTASVATCCSTTPSVAQRRARHRRRRRRDPPSRPRRLVRRRTTRAEPRARRLRQERRR